MKENSKSGKLRVSGVVICVLMFLMIMSTCVSAADVPFTIQTTKDNLNIRTEADTYSPVLTVIAESGTTLFPVDYVETAGSENPGWYKIRFDGDVYGYVYSSYVKEGGNCTVSVTVFPGAALKSDASDSGVVHKMLSKGTEVSVTGVSGDYYYGESFNGEKGYILKTSVSEISYTPLVSGTGNVAEVTSTTDAKIREGASTSYDIIKAVSKGTILMVDATVAGEDGYDWYQVTVNGTETGYIRSDTVSVTSAAVAFNGKNIVLDPGHGSYKSESATAIDDGNVNGDVKEKDINLLIALYLKSYLESAGANVTLTRDGDVNGVLSLATRTGMANAINADAFVSLHCNYSSSDVTNNVEESSRRTGVITYYFSGNNKYTVADDLITKREALASDIQSNLVVTLGSKSLGTESSNFTVLTQSTCPSVLVEFGFLSSATETEKLDTPAYQDSCAVGVFNGLYAFLK